MDMLTAMKNFIEEQPETLVEAMLHIFRTIRRTEEQWENSVRSTPAYQQVRANFIKSIQKKREQVHKPDGEVSE